jgi:hypothetical protein
VGETGIGVHRQSSCVLERHAAQNHVAVHDEIAEQAIEADAGKLPGGSFEEEMSDPGEAVTGQRQSPQQQPGALAMVSARMKITSVVPMKCIRRQVLSLCSLR